MSEKKKAREWSVQITKSGDIYPRRNGIEIGYEFADVREVLSPPTNAEIEDAAKANFEVFECGPDFDQKVEAFIRGARWALERLK